MSSKLLIIFASFFVAIGTARADRGDKFIVSTRTPFNSSAVIYVNRGSDLLEKGDLQGARQNFDAALRADPRIWPAYLDRAYVFLRQNKWEFALQDCNAAMRLRPGFFRTSILRAQIYNALGKYSESLADLDRVVSLHADDETDAEALSNRAWLRATSRDTAIRDSKAAVADATRACRLNYWKKAKYIGTLAAACAAASDFDGAVRYEQQAIKSGKYSPDELQNAQHRLSLYMHHQSLRTQ